MPLRNCIKRRLIPNRQAECELETIFLRYSPDRRKAPRRCRNMTGQEFLGISLLQSGEDRNGDDKILEGSNGFVHYGRKKRRLCG